MEIVVRITMESREANTVKVLRQHEKIFSKEFFADRAYETALQGLTKNSSDDDYAKKKA